MRQTGLGLVLCLAAGMAQAQAGAPDLALRCQFEVNPAGAYEYPAGVAAPVVVPGAGGTQAGADALNACIRAKAAAAALPVATAPQRPAQMVSTRMEGGRAVSTYSDGPASAAGTRPARAQKPRWWVNRYSNEMGTCSLTFSGGSGYRCADTARRWW